MEDCSPKGQLFEYENQTLEAFVTTKRMFREVIKKCTFTPAHAAKVAYEKIPIAEIALRD